MFYSILKASILYFLPLKDRDKWKPLMWYSLFRITCYKAIHKNNCWFAVTRLTHQNPRDSKKFIAISRREFLAEFQNSALNLMCGGRASTIGFRLIVNGFRTITDSVNQPMFMKLHTLTPHESRIHPIDFEVKRSMVKVLGLG